MMFRIEKAESEEGESRKGRRRGRGSERRGSDGGEGRRRKERSSLLMRVGSEIALKGKAVGNG